MTNIMGDTAPSLIHEFMPRYAVRQVDRIAVAATPERAYAAARNIDLSRAGFVRLLFELRILPDRLAAWARGRRYDAPLSSRIDDVTRVGSGFLVLGERDGREVVVGSVGKFWRPAIDFARVSAAEFAAFDRPGYAKLAWNLRVDPNVAGGSWITVELRVGANDAKSLARFKRYWRLVGPFSHAIRHALLRALARDLGRVAGDQTRPLEGDDILEASRFQRTHAVTIEAPPARVWPWLVQMGARRAGWYSFDALDNDGMPSAEVIRPGLQHLAVGDIIPALPRSADGFAVLRLQPERALVLGDPSLLPQGRASGGPPWRTTWAFVLEPIGAEATRLVVRARAAFAPTARMAVVRRIMGAAHAIMERRQLRNLRRRAEAPA